MAAVRNSNVAMADLPTVLAMQKTGESLEKGLIALWGIIASDEVFKLFAII